MSLITCAYLFFDLKKSKGSHHFIKEHTQYLINGKPTATTVKGNIKSGFVYTVDWADKSNLRELECASLIFNKDIISKMIFLAGLIDRNQ